MTNVAIILAAGVGRRMAAAVPKQYLPLGQGMVIDHTLDAFLFHPDIAELTVVAAKDDVAHMQAVVAAHKPHKPTTVVAGGDERWQSAAAGVERYAHCGDVNVLLHDAARPLVSAQTISDVVAALALHEAVSVAIPTKDTIYAVEGQVVSSIPNRATLWQAQTPQAFRAPLIAAAYKWFATQPQRNATDDCGVLLAYKPDAKISVVVGAPENMKITTPTDLLLTECLTSKPNHI